MPHNGVDLVGKAQSVGKNWKAGELYNVSTHMIYKHLGSINYVLGAGDTKSNSDKVLAPRGSEAQ